VALTDEQVSALDARVEEFRAADYEDREKIIIDLLNSFKSTSPRGVKFDRAGLRTVRAQSATLGCSNTFLAYSPAPLRQGQTSAEGIRTQRPKPGG
jgi:hypothetical protein